MAKVKQIVKAEAEEKSAEPKSPAMAVKRFPGCVKVKVGPGAGARVLQGQVVKYGYAEWVDLCVISPPGAPAVIVPDRKKVTKLRLIDGKTKEVIEEIEL